MTVEHDTTDDLAARLRLRRETEGTSRGTLASLLDVEEDTLADIESRRLVSGPEVDRVASWLDASRSTPHRDAR